MRRIVITGMGIVAPNAIGLEAYNKALQEQQIGIKTIPELVEMGFACTSAGLPDVTEELKSKYFSPLTLKFLTSSAITYACIAAMDAWKDAGLEFKDKEKTTEPYWNAGAIIGTGVAGVEPHRVAIYKVDNGDVRQVGGRVVEQTMNNGPAAYVSGIIGLGNKVTSNCSACSTGTEAMIDGYDFIKSGKADIMLIGSTDCSGPYIWGGFDSMRVTNRKMNDNPTGSSRPMSATASGFVPGAGSGALVLEELEHALKRGARIYGEVLGGATNNGGQRMGGTMTAPNYLSVHKCISQAMENAGIKAEDIDLISGHLTATMADPGEVRSWVEVLQLKGDDIPYINSVKSMIGHCLAASGSMECVAVLLQLHHGYIHGNPNCEDLHPEIEALVGREKVPEKTFTKELKVIGKSSFGFGDVNSVVFFQKF